MTDKEKSIIVFDNKKIRRIWHNNERYFSIVDVIKVLTDSKDSNDYWYQLKKKN
jgi:DNA-damage-inducible protein D